MKFGQFSIDDARGIVLAHAMKLPEAKFSKGHVLQDDDLYRIKAAGQISVSIVIPAAGMSSRMGKSGAHKLLAQFDGIPLVRRTALVATDSVASSVTVVLGHREQELRNAISGVDVSIVVNADYASGMSGSLASGFMTGQVRKAQGVLIMLADMPGITTADLNRLIAEFRRSGGTAIVRASSQGKPGNPVILPKALQDAVLRLEGDIGARHLIETSSLQVINVEIGPAAHIDLDTPEAIADAGGVILDISPADGRSNRGRQVTTPESN
ncbi:MULTISPECIES: NTP transferase domain-containing protein [Agrobacterium]|uniref:Nucleotidyltransferase family protein n=1 Tax=Agrobacterium tumefaciens TaxID=358 RepID=A0AAE6BHI4_AGRTU|nr:MULTISPECIES: nucleotidyltransferase family protein [Agrobacterium]QCL77196.1 nucleotidyltransferase family protein [Agrobacterium tumefaciens]QCL82704.1 nucleotidyltransferase family protein [Agrobacterium tumefaciens]CUX70456.1 hypothetical protein AGR6A_pAt50057 [Agrobacterium sp. NCPPB 925]